VRREMISSVDILPTVLEATGLDAPENLAGRSLLPLCRGETPDWREYLFTEQDGSTPFWTFPQRAVRDGRYKLIVTLLDDRPDPIYSPYANARKGFFAAGATEEELAKAPEHVQRGYATWKGNCTVQLYDLQEDPHEWTNLAATPELAEVQQRLLAALADWRRRTDDPLADESTLRRFVQEMEGIMEQKINYRRSKGFRWRYLDYFQD
jgi:N-sulfoglucosamine sulfohydrolase